VLQDAPATEIPASLTEPVSKNNTSAGEWTKEPSVVDFPPLPAETTEMPTTEEAAATAALKPASRLAGIKEKYQQTILGDLQEIITSFSGHTLPQELAELNAATVIIVWESVLHHLKEYTSQVFIEAALKVVVSWKNPSTIVVEVESKLSEGMIAENRMNLASAIRHITGRTDVQIELLLNRKNEVAYTPKKYLTDKEKFRLMVERNPVLLELQKKLDLDLE